MKFLPIGKTKAVKYYSKNLKSINSNFQKKLADQAQTNLIG